MAVFFYNVPSVFLQAFSQAGMNPQGVSELPSPSSQDIIIWYARTEQDVLLYNKMEGFQRKIILAAENLTLENRSVTALLLRQANVEMYYPFTAAHIPEVLAPTRHWYSVETIKDVADRETLPVLFSGSGKDSVALWGPPSAGKTSLALSLGAALARTKAKVLLLDATNSSDLLYWVNDPLNVITVPLAYEAVLKQQKPKLHQILPFLYVLPGNPKLPTTPEQFLYLIDALRHSFHFILVDVSSLPTDTGYTALKLMSRIVLVSTFDMHQLISWHESTFKSYLLPAHKMSLVINASYPSRVQKINTPLDVLPFNLLGHIPVNYEAVMDAKIAGTSPYGTSSEEYKRAIDHLLVTLWSISEDEPASLFKRLKSDFLKR